MYTTSKSKNQKIINFLTQKKGFSIHFNHSTKLSEDRNLLCIELGMIRQCDSGNARQYCSSINILNSTIEKLTNFLFLMFLFEKSKNLSFCLKFVFFNENLIEIFYENL